MCGLADLRPDIIVFAVRCGTAGEVNDNSVACQSMCSAEMAARPRTWGAGLLRVTSTTAPRWNGIAIIIIIIVIVIIITIIRERGRGRRPDIGSMMIGRGRRGELVWQRGSEATCPLRGPVADGFHLTLAKKHSKGTASQLAGIGNENSNLIKTQITHAPDWQFAPIGGLDFT